MNNLNEITKDDVKKAKDIVSKVLGFKRRIVIVNGHRYCCHPQNSSPLGLRYGGESSEKEYEE